MEQPVGINPCVNDANNQYLLELLHQCEDNPELLASIQQILDEMRCGSSYSQNSLSQQTTASPFSALPDKSVMELLNQVGGGPVGGTIQQLQSQMASQQDMLNSGYFNQTSLLEQASAAHYDANQLASKLEPSLASLASGDLNNSSNPLALNPQEALLRYLGRPDKFDLPPMQYSPSQSPPISTRSVQKQFSMPDKRRTVPELNIPQTPFSALAGYPFHGEILSAHSTHSIPSYRRRHNSDPVISQDLDLVKPENLKHMLQKLPPAYSAATVVAQFLPQMDVKSCCQLLKGLGKCNLHSRAWQIFQMIREIPVGQLGSHLRTTEIYNQMIQLCQNNAINALQVYVALIEDALIPGASIYGSLISICGKCDDFEHSEELYNKALQQKCVDKDIATTMVDIYSRMEQWNRITNIFQDLQMCGVEPDVQLYNSVINLSCKRNQFDVALQVYRRMLANDVLPSHKSMVVIRPAVEALFSPKIFLSKMEDGDNAAIHSKALIHCYVELITKHSPQDRVSVLFQILMTCFDKQGEVGFATALYDYLKESGVCGKLSLDFCNIAISACAHQGHYEKAQTIFDDMESSCEVQPQAVTYANLLRAYKKGGQWCQAIQVFEQMKEAGHVPHGAVYGSCLDLCWKAGVPWASQKASEILEEGFDQNLLDDPEEVLQRNTLRLDLRALTCGAAVLTMRHWLSKLKGRLANGTDPNLLCVKRIVVVNGVGEGTKGQTSCTVVKNAVSASLSGHRSPFTLTQDSRLLKLEAQMAVLKDWLFSEDFNTYYSSFGSTNSEAAPVIEYLAFEKKQQQQCGQVWNELCMQQALSRPHLQAMPPDYVHIRMSLIVHLQELHTRLSLSELSLFSCITLMDVLMSSGSQLGVTQWEMMRLPVLCTHFIHSANDIADSNNTTLFAGLAQCNSEQFNALVQKFGRLVPGMLVSPIHFLRLFLERLGVSLEDATTQGNLAVCSQLVLDVVSQPACVQFPASIVASAILGVFRKECGLSPEWPSVLAQLTSYPEDHPNLLECQKLVMISRGRVSSIRAPSMLSNLPC
eukprot:TRINITY_DN10367_c0_g2_i4.p1 TRINITY_DN10367_c0_g2~~TRINITY_DN10367_c0_g2_i4.p1  ORF type:complete len:1042 (-),score=85.47 TRINITY_DN10367_c0_g2_i4:2579-5704(-)